MDMTQQNKKPVGIHMDGRKLKREPDTKLKLFSKAKLEKLIEEAVVDAYGEEEQVGGFFTMMEEHLALPFSATILGVDVVVEKVDMIRSGRIVAICRRNKIRQKIEILDLPLPTPAPAGAEWIAAYHHWRRGF
jgi:calcium binding protein